MHLIVGLGNPGKEYEDTRHNVGFNFIDNLSLKYNISLNRIKFKGVYGEGFIQGEKCILLKPSTYMNLSGESVREIVNFYKIDSNDIIIVYDDISIEIGRMRIRTKGSAGGHNGIKSIISNLGTDEFPRIKIGVGCPKGDLISHVLGKFSKEDKMLIDNTIKASTEAVELIVKENLYESMNKFNGFIADK